MIGTASDPVQFRIEIDKVVRYRLDPDHADGGPKRRFLSVGFSIGDPVTLMAALADHPRPERITKVSVVSFGLR